MSWAQGHGGGQRTISVTRAVDVTVVAGGRLVLDMRRVDSDTTSLLFRCLVNLVVVGELGSSILGEDLGDSSSQGGLAVVDVTCRNELSNGSGTER